LMHSDLSHSLLLDVNDVTSVNRLLSTSAGCPPPLSTWGSKRKLKGRGSSRCKILGVLITIGIMAGISNHDGAVPVSPSSARTPQPGIPPWRRPTKRSSRLTVASQNRVGGKHCIVGQWMPSDFRNARAPSVDMGPEPDMLLAFFSLIRSRVQEVPNLLTRDVERMSYHIGLGSPRSGRHRSVAGKPRDSARLNWGLTRVG
jgi:hypothetical protein